MKLLFYLTIALFSWGQLGRISFFNQQVNGYLYEFPLFFSLLYLLWQLKLEPIRKGLKDFKALFFFLAALFFSYLWFFFQFSFFENFVAALYFSRLLMYLAYGGYLVYWLKKRPSFKHQLRRGFYFLGAVVLFSSFIQYFLYPDLRNLWYLGWDPHFSRMFGTFLDTSVAAAIYGIFFLFLILPVDRLADKDKFYKTLRKIFIPIFLIGVVLTFSRGAYIALTLSLIWYFFSEKKFSLIFVFFVAFLLAILASPKPFGEGVNLKRIFSIQARLDDYKHAINIWKKSPFIGFGYNRIRFVKGDLFQSHAASSFSSSYLNILVTAGIFGILGALAMLRQLWLRYKNGRVIILFLVFFSLTDNIFLHPFILFLTAIFFSLISDK